MILTKTIKDYRIKRQRGFFTVERLYLYRFLFIAYKEEWKAVEHIRKSKHFGNVPIELPMHFNSIKQAQEFVKREVSGIVEKANKRVENTDTQNLRGIVISKIHK